ncbi:MAG: tRNA (guanosine(37)-N1)-methyltransferase TrmD [candidate division KSB1 bacterium]|nr:tRNA (guanosine(37)-N1)-methyltransferase TrmD [candidate division KSB1 bacterium]
MTAVRLRIHLVTGFPNLVQSPLQESILRRAQAKGLVRIDVYDLRRYTTDKHKQIDDYPYGGGPGMILKPEPIFRCVRQILKECEPERPRVILLTPDGVTFHQKLAEELSRERHLVLISGHYKGVDERVRQALVTDEISIGDYVLSGGELPALVLIDAVVRLVPGVLSDFESASTDSFARGLLDHPHYTRPEVFEGMRVPEVLLSGHHAEIEKWRLEQALERTRLRRPDLYERYLREKACEKDLAQ